MVPAVRMGRSIAITLFAALALMSTACTAEDPQGAAGQTPDDDPVATIEPASAAVTAPPTATSSEVMPTVPLTTADDTEATETIPAVDPLACLSTRARIAQLLLPLATQAELADAQSLAGSGDLGGIGLLGSPDQGLAAELLALQQASLYAPILVASDEEGGSVQRLAGLLGPLPSAAEAASTQSPEQVREAWAAYGEQVRELGIDVVFGPVLDVGGGPGIGSRSFGSDPAIVTTYGAAVADGLLQVGLMPVFKHFPGHGRATADSHLELPSAPSLDELRSTDLVPYADLLSRPEHQGRAGVMVGHLAVPGLSGSVPTSLSPEAINGLLRGELGFGGLVFTDALNMGAIVDGYGVAQAIELAIVAGADIAILGSLAEVRPALDYLVSRAGADPELAALFDNRTLRVLATKASGDICAGAQ